MDAYICELSGVDLQLYPQPQIFVGTLTSDYMIYLKYFGLFLMFILLISCDSDITSISYDQATKSLEDYAVYGKIHNEYMQYAYEQFPDERLRGQALNGVKEYSRDAKLKVLEGFTSEYAPELCLFGTECDRVYPNNQRETVYELQRRGVEKFLDEMIKKGHTSIADRDITLGLIDDLNNVTNIDDIYTAIDNYEKQWVNESFSGESDSGDISAATLSIASYSAEFWINNEDALHKIHGNPPTYKFPWILVGIVVRNDVIGGCAGIVASQAAEAAVTGQWGGHDGVVTGDEVAASFISGAVTGSLGL